MVIPMNMEKVANTITTRNNHYSFQIVIFLVRREKGEMLFSRFFLTSRTHYSKAAGKELNDFPKPVSVLSLSDSPFFLVKGLPEYSNKAFCYYLGFLISAFKVSNVLYCSLRQGSFPSSDTAF